MTERERINKSMLNMLEKQFVMQNIRMKVCMAGFSFKEPDDNKELCNLLFALNYLGVI